MNQQEEEILVFDQFRKYYPEFPKGKLLKSESPDFILKVNPKKSIGIELTRLDILADSLYDRIWNSIQKKELKIGIYQKKNFKDIWLIIYADYLEDDKSYNLNNNIAGWKFDSKFDKIFILDLFLNNLHIIS